MEMEVEVVTLKLFNEEMFSREGEFLVTLCIAAEIITAPC